MLNLITIDRLFEETWKEYTERNSGTDNAFLLLYLEKLEKEVSRREDRRLPSMDSFVEAIKAVAGNAKVSVNDNGFNVSFHDQSFSVIERKPGWLVLNAIQCHFQADVTVWEPNDAALLMFAAGTYREKAGERWGNYHRAKKEAERLCRIEFEFLDKRDALVERYAKDPSSEASLESFKEEFLALLQDTFAQKNVPLDQADKDRGLEDFLRLAEKKKKAFLRQQRASEKAQEKRAAQKDKEQHRYEEELRHLTEVIGIPPVVTRRTPLGNTHFIEYRYPMSNGQSFSIKDYTKSPARVEKVATTVMYELQMMIPYLASQYRISSDRYSPTPAMLRYYNQKAMKAVGEESPFRALIEALTASGTVSFHVSSRFFSIQYYFIKGYDRCLRFSLPRFLEPGQIDAFTGHLKAFISHDKAMRKGPSHLDYAFDMPEKR